MTAAVEKAVSILIKDGELRIGLEIGIERIGEILIFGCVQPPSVSDKWVVGRVRSPSVSAAAVVGVERGGVLIMECGGVIDTGRKWAGGALPPSVAVTCAL
jgi:hypothetical protein